MQKIAKFQKVSETQFIQDWLDTFPASTAAEAAQIYDQIQLPKRATTGSAGYDFFAPQSFSLNPGESLKIPTGIRVQIAACWVLKCYPRSGLGFKYRLQFNNTVGIIDSDYYGSDNESREGKTLSLAQGEGFMQGIFVEYGITVDDDADQLRNGGFGSTTQK